MAEKKPAPKGAGDLGEVVTHLRGAADALRHADWASLAAHLKVVFEEAMEAVAGGHTPHVMGTAEGKSACHEQAEKLDAAAARAEAGAVDWAALLQVLLPLLLTLFKKQPAA
jgi:hypothetical protein